MSTVKISPEEFGDKFGKDNVVKGSFEYFKCGEIGIVKDLNTKSLEFIPREGADINLTQEEELAMLDMVCGSFKKDEEVVPPTNDAVEELKEAEYEEGKASKFTSWVGVIGALVVVAFVLYRFLSS